MGCCLGAHAIWIYGFFDTFHYVVVDAVLDIWGAILNPEEPQSIGLVFREKYFRRTFTVEPATAGASRTLLTWI